MMSKNEVEMQGRIVYARKQDNGRTTFVVEMHERARTNSIRWTYTGDLPDGITRRDKVVVKGYVVSYARRTQDGNKWESVQYFVADSVEKAKSTIEEEFGLRGNFFKSDYFIGKFSGQVSRVIANTNSENWGKLIVMVDADSLTRQASHVVFSYLKSGRLPAMNKYEVGDTVYVIASLNTVRKQQGESNQETIFENMIVEDIAKGRKPLEEKVG